MHERSSSLSIGWSMDFPPTPLAQDWHSWETDKGYPHRLDAKLHQPSGTFTILQEALTLNLSRQTGWDLKKIAHKKPYEAAASLYRRGVICSDQKKTTIKGQYQIYFLGDDQEPPIPEEKSGKLVIIDQNIVDNWQITPASHILPFNITEQSKTLETVAELIELVKKAAQISSSIKSCTIIGGGVLCDTAAFALSLINMDFQLVPTTLLAMVDACVGGKSGVNAPPFGKNQIGLFRFPKAVYIWTQWLNTLEKRHLICGYAESLKHCIISGHHDLYHQIHSKLQQPGKMQHHDLYDIVKVKAEIVERDPTESNERATLNLGHTLAHALEKISHETTSEIILHGEAVAIGLAFTVILSEKTNHINTQTKQKLLNFIEKSSTLISMNQLKIHLGQGDLNSDYFRQKLTTALSYDKKNHRQQTHWVLLSNDEKPLKIRGKYTHKVEASVVLKAWTELLNYLT